MPAAHEPRLLAPRLLTRFALVGVGATLLYALLALLFEEPLGPVAASVTAYAICAVVSYCGHKFLTFTSSGAHRVELPRFLALTAAGFAVATALPVLVTGVLGWPAILSVAATCILIPAVNLVALDRWVFARR